MRQIDQQSTSPWLVKNAADSSPYLSDINFVPNRSVYGVHDTAELIRETVRKHLVSTTYDITPYISEAIAAQSPDFAFDSWHTIQSYRGSNCIGLSLELLSRLVFTYGSSRFPSIYLIPSSLPAYFGIPSDVFGHVALLMVCSDGLILLESGFHIPRPIILIKDQPFIFKNDQFSYHCLWTGSEKIFAELITQRRGSEKFEYTIKHISNPDISITQSQTAERSNISYVARNEKGEVTQQIKVNRAKSQIEASDTDTNQSVCVAFTDFGDNLSRQLAVLASIAPLPVLCRIMGIATTLISHQNNPRLDPVYCQSRLFEKSGKRLIGLEKVVSSQAFCALD